MLLSFLVCVHKDHEFLDSAIKSMLDQDYNDDYKIYIVANNCSDALWEKIATYLSENERIVAHRTHIGQLCFNLNYGANIMQSQYIVRMDGDDLCLPNRLRCTHQTIMDTDYPDVVVGQCSIIDHNGKTTGQNKVRSASSIRSNLPFRNTIVHPATAIKRRTLLDERGYSGGFVSEDIDLWIRFFRNDRRFVIMSDTVIKYRKSIDQEAGSQLAYAEYASYLLREFLLTGRPRFFLGFLSSTAKTLIRAAQKLMINHNA